MQPVALSFDLTPAGSTGNSYYQDGSGEILPPASPQISPTATLGSPADATFQVSQPGPWVESPTLRYQMLRDETTLKMVMKKSLDGGVTWNEMDATHAPSINNNSALPFTYNGFACARDTSTAIAKVYAVFWNPGNTLSGVTFDMSTDKWGAVHVSVLGWLNTTAGAPNISLAPAGIFRGSDGSFIVGLNTGGQVIGLNTWYRTYYAKFKPSTGVWDGAWIPCGTTDVTETNNWFVFGFVEDLTGNIHIQFATTTTNPGNYQIMHQVLHADNTLSMPDLVHAIAALDVGSSQTFLSRPVARTVSATVSELLFTYAIVNHVSGNIQAWVARGTASDAPVWAQELIYDPGAAPAAFFGCQLLDVGDGTIQGIIIPGVGAGNATWSYLYNFTLGSAWIKTFLCTTTTAASPGFSNVSIALAGPAPPPPGTLNSIPIAFVGPVVLPDPRVLCRFGEQKRCRTIPTGKRLLAQGTFYYGRNNTN